jgi:hypothetical protein
MNKDVKPARQGMWEKFLIVISGTNREYHPEDQSPRFFSFIRRRVFLSVSVNAFGHLRFVHPLESSCVQVKSMFVKEFTVLAEFMKAGRTSDENCMASSTGISWRTGDDRQKSVIYLRLEGAVLL